ncbi:hypothetical protein SRB17_47090 [Streptomyces sp. RB17]|nr:hypothetical protein [Streptomyces sp. RB17]
MRFFGLLLLAGAAAFTALAIAGNLSGGPDYTVSVLDHDVATMSGLALFSSGLALALIFCAGLAIMVSGMAHAGRHRSSRPRRMRHTTLGGTPGPGTRA